MTLRHLPRAGFASKPWKNGQGTTHDIALLPEGADHNSFDLRFALSPITSDGPFSSFPGADRVITPITGNGLHLTFDDHDITIPRLASHRFDTGLAPLGRLLDGPVEVVNVMARRKSWQFLDCGLTDISDHDLGDEDLLFLFAVEAPLTLTTATSALTLEIHDAALVQRPGLLKITSSAPVLVARLRPRR